MQGATSPSIPPAATGGVNNASGANSFRITVVAEKLATCAVSNRPEDVTVFFNLCISLSRGIDYAVASNETPDRVSKLPEVCKLVCKKKMDQHLLSAVMVLMIAMKHACKSRWFSLDETREILALADEVGRVFNTYTPEVFSSELNKVIPSISQIMSRYYPQIKLGNTLICTDVKPGYQTCALSFHVSKNMRSMSPGNIQLLVARKDNIDTSACIINPPKVNFLVNGKGVPWRTIDHMETGPQLPTDVIQLLRYGTNLLQAVGHFDAHYVVLVAFLNLVPPSFLPVPADYEQPATGAEESDAEVVEGSSRISLNCPISISRIGKPAKGKLCKHLQCFDLSNYVEMNSRHPLWRCPTCNQPVCYPDLRIDRKMSKILQEVAKDVTNVIFHSDGSWEAISGSAEQKDEPPVKSFKGLQGGSDLQVASGMPNETRDVCDLTEGDDEPVVMDVDTPQDRKPEINPTSVTQVQGLSFSGPYGSAAFSSRTNGESVGGLSAPMRGHITPSAVLTDSVSPAIRREQHNFLGTNQQSTPSVVLTDSVSPAIRREQHNFLGTNQQSSPLTLYPGHALPSYVNRMPPANQALPRVMPRPNPMMANSPLMNNLSGNVSSLPSRAPVSANASMPIRGSVQHPQITQHQAINQMRVHNATMLQMSSTPPHQMSSTPPHLRTRTQVPPGGSLSNLNRTTAANQLYHPMGAASQAASMAAAASQAALRTRQLNTAPIQMPRTSPASVPRSADGMSYVSQGRGPTSAPARMATAVSRTQDLVGTQSEQQNWQPTGRMRGSLTGRACSDAINEFMIRPTQQTTPAPIPAPAPAALPGQPPNNS